MKKSSFKNIPIFILLFITLLLSNNSNAQVFSNTSIVSSSIDLVRVNQTTKTVDVYYHFELHSSSLRKNAKYKVTWKTEAKYSGMAGYQVNFHHSRAASNMPVRGRNIAMNAVSGSGFASSSNSATGLFDSGLGEDSPSSLIIDLIDDAPIDEACEIINGYFIEIGVIDPKVEELYGSGTVQYMLDYWDEYCVPVIIDNGGIGGPPKVASKNSVAHALVDPNPFNSHIQVNLNERMGPSVTQVMDMSGKVWVTQKSTAGNILQLNLQHLPRGSYILRVDDGKTHKQKIIIKN